ncbi:sugar kinase [Pararobbsia silviterrae]|uniref:Sugar kinase n=1 Tax=Pararobbsia silviterrae TaxID=1792498 RepID=A0A494XUX0_9BURK|nr:sugar kinase [Pararobbsia silviterrae]RKP51869.1 sugar kinase [Pararobbsia silviterrae]
MAASDDVGRARGPAILSIGEPMLELNQSPVEPRQFLQGFGGDTSNFCCVVARQGGSVGYITRLGDDAFGRRFLDLWHEEQIDVRGVAIDPHAHTGLYFVTHSEAGHEFSYMRKGSAASRMRPEDLPLDLIDQAKFLHVSGISQAISETACDTVFAAVERARAAGVAIAYDPNVRLKLWPQARAKAIVEATLQYVDYFLPSFEDAQILTGLSDPDAILDRFVSMGLEQVCLKLGSRGVIVAHEGERTHFPAHRVAMVDATGAGDCFDGAFITRIALGDSIANAARYANAAAALATTGYGAVAPIPRPDAVYALLETAA